MYDSASNQWPKDSLHIVGSCRFRLYRFSHRDFAIPHFHPAFDPKLSETNVV